MTFSLKRTWITTRALTAHNLAANPTRLQSRRAVVRTVEGW